MNPMKTPHMKRSILVAISIVLAVSLSLSALLITEAVAPFAPRGVTIAGFAFVPQSTTINCGEPFVWNNTDPVINTLWFVYAANGSTYLLSPPILPETTWTHIFTELTELQYYSFDKLWMTGTARVKLLGDLGGGLPPTFFNFDDTCDGKDLALFLMCYKGTAPPAAMYLGDLGGGLPPTFFAYDGADDGKDLALFLMCYKGQGPCS